MQWTEIVKFQSSEYLSLQGSTFYSPTWMENIFLLWMKHIESSYEIFLSKNTSFYLYRHWLYLSCALQYGIEITFRNCENLGLNILLKLFLEIVKN